MAVERINPPRDGVETYIQADEPATALPGDFWVIPNVSISVWDGDSWSPVSTEDADLRARVDPPTSTDPGKVWIQGPTTPKFDDMETVIYDHVMERSATPATNRVNMQTLLDRLAPGGSGKQVRLFIPPQFDESGNPVPIVVDRRASSAWAVRISSGTTIEGAGRGSMLQLAGDSPTFSRIFNIQDAQYVTLRNIALDGNTANNNPTYAQNHNINIVDSQYILVEDVESFGATGDGAYAGRLTGNGSQYVVFNRFRSYDNDRNPLSVCDVDDVWIYDADLDCRTGGQAIDSEPLQEIVRHGLYIRGGKLVNSSGIADAYAVALGGKSMGSKRVRTRMLGVELDGGIHHAYAEDLVVADCIGAITRVYANLHTRDIIYTGNNWDVTTSANFMQVDTNDATKYPEKWTVTDNNIRILSGTGGMVFWDVDDLTIGGNTIEGPSSGIGLSLRPSTKAMRNINIMPNTWRNFANGIYAQASGAFGIAGLGIDRQMFDGVTTREIDLQTNDYITNLVIGPQQSAIRLRVGNGTAIKTGLRSWECHGTPEGVITAPVGAQAFRRDGGAGTTLYTKESGTGNTGWVGLASDLRPVTTKTANYTATASDYTIRVDATAAPVTITLPVAVVGKVFEIVKTDNSANDVIVDGNGSDVINIPGTGPALTATLADQFSMLIIKCTVANQWSWISAVGTVT